MLEKLYIMGNRKEYTIDRVNTKDSFRFRLAVRITQSKWRQAYKRKVEFNRWERLILPENVSDGWPWMGKFLSEIVREVLKWTFMETQLEFLEKCAAASHIYSWFYLLAFRYSQSTVTQKYYMQNSRNKHFITFKLQSILRIMMKSWVAPSKTWMGIWRCFPVPGSHLAFCSLVLLCRPACLLIT